MKKQVDIIEEYNLITKDDMDIPSMTVKALQQVVEVYNDSKELVKLLNEGEVPSEFPDRKTLEEYAKERLKRVLLYDEINVIDTDMFDLFIYPKNTKFGETNMVIVTMDFNESKKEFTLSKCIEFGIVGDDYGVIYDIDEILQTIKKHLTR